LKLVLISMHCINVYLIAVSVGDFKLNAHKVLKDWLIIEIKT